MKTDTITINDKTYKVIIAESEEDKRRGLRGVEKLPQGKGMLFVWNEPQEVSMTMDETLIPLDQIFIDSDGEVLKVAHRQDTEQDKLESCKDCQYVLELNIDSGVEEGDVAEGDMFDQGNENTPIMKVLAPDGSTQGEIHSGQRIFSRKNTLILLKQAKRAYSSKKDSDYKRLGKSVFKYLKTQDTREPEYVASPS